VSIRNRIGRRLLVRCPQHPVALARVPNQPQVRVDLLVRLAPEVRAFESARVLLEDEPGVVAANLLRHDLRDVAAGRVMFVRTSPIV